MSEMLEIVRKLVLLLSLYGFAWIDYKTKRFPVVLLWLFGVVGLFWGIASSALMREELRLVKMSQLDFWWEMTSGAVVGIGLLMLSILSREQIGKGDALLFISVGMYLDFAQNLTLLFRTLLFVGCFSFGCLLLKKKGKNDSVAMGPFLLAAYVTLL